MKHKTISIIIPASKYEQCESTLKFLNSLDYPQQNLEIIVVLGNQPSIQRNIAAGQSKGEILLFLNHDCILCKNYFYKMLNHYENLDIAVVGGPALTNPESSFIEKCFGYIYSSYFGLMSSRARYKSVGKIRETDEKEIILCNMSIRKDIFTELGGFNEKLYPNEENELLNRIKNSGKFKIIYDPELIVYRHHRNNIPAFSKQLFFYGWGRTRHFIINSKYFNFFYIVPLCFVFYLISLIIFHPLWYMIPLFIYILLDIFFSILIYRESKNLKILLVSIFLFPLLHISYGIGIFCGISKYFNPARNKIFHFELKKVKEISI